MSKDDCFRKICDKQDILLERNNLGDFKISLVIEQNNADANVFEIIKNGDFFDLLYQLNEDIIEKYENKKEDNDPLIDNILILFKNIFEDDTFDEMDDVFLNLKTQSKFILDNKCEIIGLDVKTTNDINNINIDNLLVSIEKINNKFIFIVTFKISGNASDIIKTYVGYYLKKIFYKIQQYFE
jgi:hypothetical protein